MPPPPLPNPASAAHSHSPTDWHAQELLLMREVMRLISRGLAPGLVLREMLHLMTELLGLNRGRIVLVDGGGCPGGGAAHRLHTTTAAPLRRWWMRTEAALKSHRAR